LFRRLAIVLAAMFVVATGAARAQTNYPATATLVIRDSNGLTIEGGVFVDDPLTVRSTGWGNLVNVQAEYLSEVVQLGTFKSDANGVLTFVFKVPNAEPVPGTHTLRLIGNGANGQLRSQEGAIPVKKRPAGTGTDGAGTGGSGTGGSGTGGTGTGGSGTGGAGTGSGTGGGSNVLGSAIDNNTSNSGAFGKTGANVATMVQIGFALLAIGATVAMAARKRRDTVTF